MGSRKVMPDYNGGVQGWRLVLSYATSTLHRPSTSCAPTYNDSLYFKVFR